MKNHNDPIPYSRQVIDEDDVESVVRVLRSRMITQGPCVPEFECQVSKKVEAKYGIAGNSATSMLHLACIALGLKTGDYFWTSPMSFVASANCGLYCDAKVDFVDIDRYTGNIDVEKLTSKLEDAAKNNELPRVLVVVDYSGIPCDAEEISNIARKYDVRVIDDASHSLGASYHEKPIGCGDYYDISVFSFHPVKSITTAEGGMAVTNSEEIAETLRILRSHGVTRSKEFFRSSEPPAWHYEQQLLGYNYRMNELQAALGISQLGKLDKLVGLRKDIADLYLDKLRNNYGLILPKQFTDRESSNHLFPVQLIDNAWSTCRNIILEMLRTEGIGATVHYPVIYLQPYYEDLGFKEGLCPEAEKFSNSCISLPNYPGMTEDDVDYIVNCFNNALNKIT